MAKHEIISYVGNQYKFLPKEYSTLASVDIFGNRVNLASAVHLGGIDKDMMFSVILNQQVADAFRTWFKFMWDFCPDVK